MPFVIQNGLGGLAYGALLFLIAAGFTQIFGLMRIVNLAQTSFYLVGAYIGLTLAEHGVNFWLATLAAGLAVMVLGVFVYGFFLQRYQRRDLTTLLLTLGVSLMMDDAALAIWGGNPQSINPPKAFAASVTVGGAQFPTYWLVLIALSLVIAAALYYFQQRTSMGAVIRAGVDDEEMARGLGVNVNQSFYLVFAIGAFLAGAAGMLGGPILGVAPGLDTDLLALAFAVVIIGGMGSLTGALVGSLVIGLINNFGEALFPSIAYFTIFAPVALVMATRPQGLFGRKQA